MLNSKQKENLDLMSTNKKHSGNKIVMKLNALKSIPLNKLKSLKM